MSLPSIVTCTKFLLSRPNPVTSNSRNHDTYLSIFVVDSHSYMVLVISQLHLKCLDRSLLFRSVKCVDYINVESKPHFFEQLCKSQEESGRFNIVAPYPFRFVTKSNFDRALHYFLTCQLKKCK